MQRLRSRSKVGVKLKGQGQMCGVQRSILGARFAECSKGNYLQVWSKEWSVTVKSIRVCVLGGGIGG